jgi:predicted amidohydrolase
MTRASSCASSSAWPYVEAVKTKQARDPVLGFQLRNGFEILGVLPAYMPGDNESLGYAVHMVWRNPNIPADQPAHTTKRYGGRLPDTVRVATVQYQQRKVTSFEQFLEYVEYFVDVVADYRADFVVFPELFSLQLLSIEDQKLNPAQSIEALTKYTEPLTQALHDMAMQYNINIIGGSHPTRVPNGRVENISYVFLRDGSVHQQPKIHPTPNEVYWWNIEGGDTLHAIETDCGPIGVLICYDSEFPELSRHLIDQGVGIIFVPFCTDERQSYLRVRYCCAARAVENQCFVVMSGNCGNLPGVANMDIQYAQSCILTPCDFPFARDGIAADTTPNVETVAFADLRLETLYAARNNGTVKNLKDRRHDLYSVIWRE